MHYAVRSNLKRNKSKSYSYATKPPTEHSSTDPTQGGNGQAIRPTSSIFIFSPGKDYHPYLFFLTQTRHKMDLQSNARNKTRLVLLDGGYLPVDVGHPSHYKNLAYYMYITVHCTA
ncbi:hypothetical protein BaRGS_00027460 [Batillaria attramentaria]|uniref:Uncharacterized protein n=1 Tax=Batillaria attramentaria TaxID=370345 RepID=A0ABD0K2L1_9CAEN